jgi:hypothetical protein
MTWAKVSLAPGEYRIIQIDARVKRHPGRPGDVGNMLSLGNGAASDDREAKRFNFIFWSHKASW